MLMSVSGMKFSYLRGSGDDLYEIVYMNGHSYINIVVRVCWFVNVKKNGALIGSKIQFGSLCSAIRRIFFNVLSCGASRKSEPILYPCKCKNPPYFLKPDKTGDDVGLVSYVRFSISRGLLHFLCGTPVAL